MERDVLHQATAAEVRAGLRAARRWAHWSRWWSRRARELKTAAIVAGAIAAIVGSVRMVLWRESPRDVGRADVPPNGGDRMFVDRVDKPKAP